MLHFDENASNNTSMSEFHEKLGGEIKDFSIKSKEVDSEADKPKYGLVSKVKKLLGWS